MSFKKIYSFLIITIITIALFELLSFIIIKLKGGDKIHYPYFNRTISPYYVFGNSPYYNFNNTIKKDSNEKDLMINSYGFISDNEIKQEKDTNTLRIFLCGGSACFGSGQTEGYSIVHSYPNGIYSYQLSIAGQLKKQLQNIFPFKKIEVINACGVQRMIHQSVIYYMETLAQFNPDVIISFDGMNDLTDFIGISPYTKSSLQLDTYIELYKASKSLKNKSISHSIQLFNLLNLNNIKESVKNESQKNIKYYYGYNYNLSTFEEYLHYKPLFIKNTKLFSNQISYFNSVCKLNNTRFIFCLQSLLHRKKHNKSLHPYEKLFQQYIRPVNVRMHFSTINTKEINRIEKLIDLEIKYFFDDYLSPHLDSLSIKNDFIFIDFNKEIQQISDSVEFYTDYCHLTPEGNFIVAKNLANKIANIIHSASKQ